MFAPTRPAALDASATGDAWAPFRVEHPQERRTLLRRLCESSAPVNLAASDGTVLTTTLWALDDRGLTFAADRALPQLERLLDADEAVAVAYLDSVKLQFELHGLVLVHGAQASTLRCSLPRALYRFQRRNAYRVRPLERHAPTARLAHPALPEMRFALRVLDVSLGGCALWQPDDVPPLAAGSTIGGVEITLDAQTRFGATLTLQHVSSLAAHARGVRLGCEWRLAGLAEHSLQRWIHQAEKRRRLLTLG
ncbi:MAG TPA: flagellar brake protein [Rubrivivax sp.]|nr:flagellar brake protein [Rubrivivax sp.]HPO19729.1 flagellar brake protein [Rubrivivax sp.]